MSEPRKRFYRSAAVVAADGGFRLTLDERPVRTPGGADFMLPNRALAEAVAEEWLAQGERIRPETMPLTQMMATAIDRVAASRQAVAERLLAYGETDLLCYRAEEPAELAARQEECWQPLLDWLAEALRVDLVVTRGVMPVEQPPAALEALAKEVAALDEMRLTALAAAAQATGSLVIGLALVGGRVAAETAFELAQLDETYQIEKWGEDEELVERRRRLKEEIAGVAAFLDLLGAGPAAERRGTSG